MEDNLETLKAKAKKVLEESAELKDNLKNSDEIKMVREFAINLADEASHFVRRYPLPSIIGATAFGILIGTLLNRKK